ncbi:hypothetical protein DSM107003_28400 [Trichormus variabilis SAG 1403-4b]|uniref:Uncharacterized protein n=1 Tax=Trichormus variabilis SAG 1403-4b TaxID=447716 RepID=A0A3S1CNN1_ANAVA|nr:hypothetical protein DSM107003_28400 [Trichormus variabilis SAG 1403-4b]
MRKFDCLKLVTKNNIPNAKKNGKRITSKAILLNWMCQGFIANNRAASKPSFGVKSSLTK